MNPNPSGSDVLTTRNTPFDIPLQASPDYRDDILDNAGKLTALLYGEQNDPATMAKRDFIIRAVNSFDDMLAALKDAHKLLTAEYFGSSDDLIKRCEEIGEVVAKAIAKAGSQ